VTRTQRGARPFLHPRRPRVPGDIGCTTHNGHRGAVADDSDPVGWNCARLRAAIGQPSREAGCRTRPPGDCRSNGPLTLGRSWRSWGRLERGGRVSSASGPSGEPESALEPSLGTTATASRSTDAARGAAVVAAMVRVIGHPLEGGGRFPEGAEDRHAVGGIGPARSGTRATCTLVATNTNVSEVRYGRRAT
jgi:hypothetical protein